MTTDRWRSPATPATAACGWPRAPSSTISAPKVSYCSLTLDRNARDLAVDPDTDRVWVATEGRMRAFEDGGLPVAALPVDLGQNPKVLDLDLDPEARYLWVAPDGQLRAATTSTPGPCSRRGAWRSLAGWRATATAAPGSRPEAPCAGSMRLGIWSSPSRG